MEWISQQELVGRAALWAAADSDMAFAQWPSPILAKPGARGWTEGLAGERIRVCVHSDQVMGRFSQLEVLVEPGREMLKVRHSSTDLLIHVIQGQLKLFCDGSDFEAGHGTVVALPRDTAHGWVASGNAPAKLMITYTPGGIEGLIRACRGLMGSDLELVAKTFGTEILGPETR